MSGQVKHVVRLVVDVAVEYDGVGAGPITAAMARELAIGHGSRAWIEAVGLARWAVGKPTVISASIVDSSPVITESDTEDMGMGEPASVPPVAKK
jgi:hypothetical protein